LRRTDIQLHLPHLGWLIEGDGGDLVRRRDAHEARRVWREVEIVVVRCIEVVHVEHARVKARVVLQRSQEEGVSLGAAAVPSTFWNLSSYKISAGVIEPVSFPTSRTR